MPTKLEKLQLQAKFLTVIRNFLTTENFTEVSVPVLNKSVPLEPTIYPFQTLWQNNQVFWLSTSPEKTLKSALAAGLNQVFAIGHSFRDLEQAGPIHQPEFLMLEWYRKNSDLDQIQLDIKNLLGKLQADFRSTSNLNLIDWQTISLTTEFKKTTGLNLNQVITDKAMKEFAKTQNFDVTDCTWEQLFNQWFLNRLEPQLKLKPTFLIDFPARISPLCSTQKIQPELAERFEVYLAGIEIGNGNLDQTAVPKVRIAFETEQKSRLKQNIIAPGIDEEFLTSLDQLKDQPIAGIGLGLDRIFMLLTGQSQI
jgi:elongation factor P--beta-lysine ligase